MIACIVIILLLGYPSESDGQISSYGLEHCNVTDVHFLDGVLYAATIDSGVFLRILGDTQWTGLGLEGKRVTSIASQYLTPLTLVLTAGIWPRSGSGDSTLIYRYFQNDWISADEGIEQGLIRINLVHSYESGSGDWISVALGEWSPILRRINGDWEEVTAFDLNGLALASSPAGTLLCSGQSGFGASMLLMSTDDGNTWSDLLDGSGLSFGLILSLAFDPTDDNVFFAGSQGLIRRTSDHGNSWDTLLAANCTFDAITVHPYDSDVIYSGGVSGDSARVFESTDGGENWLEISLPDSLAGVTDLAIAFEDSMVVLVTTPGQGVYRMTRPSTISMQYVRYGWNMLSLPRTLDSYQASSIYPSRTSKAYVYRGSYVDEDTLSNGDGYWIKFDQTQTIAIEGLERSVDTISVQEGWNLIGSISHSITVHAIESIPGGIVTSEFYGYDGEYSVTSEIKPGKAYWVKVDQPGELILSHEGNAPMLRRIRINPIAESPPKPPSREHSSVDMPHSRVLLESYPNPFNPTTMIRYRHSEDGWVSLQIYNLLGEQVLSIVDEYQSAGSRFVRFDATGLPGGIYFCRLNGGNYSVTGKLVLIK